MTSISPAFPLPRCRGGSIRYGVLFLFPVDAGYQFVRPATLHFILVKFLLHTAISVVIAVLYSSRPRSLRLARSISSRAVFVALDFVRYMFK